MFGFKRRARQLESLTNRIASLEVSRQNDFERVGRVRRTMHEMNVQHIQRHAKLSNATLRELSELGERLEVQARRIDTLTPTETPEPELVYAVDYANDDQTTGIVAQLDNGVMRIVATFSVKHEAAGLGVTAGEVTLEVLAPPLQTIELPKIISAVAKARGL